MPAPVRVRSALESMHTVPLLALIVVHYVFKHIARIALYVVATVWLAALDKQLAIATDAQVHRCLLARAIPLCGRCALYGMLLVRGVTMRRTSECHSASKNGWRNLLRRSSTCVLLCSYPSAAKMGVCAACNTNKCAVDGDSTVGAEVAVHFVRAWTRMSSSRL